MIYPCLMNHTDRTGVYAEGRRSCPTNANRCVARNATPEKIREKEETTLKRSNECRKRFDRLRGRRPYGEGVPQVTLRATQRLSIVGRLHRPAYRCGTVYLCLKNRIACTGQTHRSAPTLALLHRRFHDATTRCRGGPTCPPETKWTRIHTKG